MSTAAEFNALWHIEFAKVISCTKCSNNTYSKLMRDCTENVPQPGYIGIKYENAKLLLVGQNPYFPNPQLVAQDRQYTTALRVLRDEPSEENYGRLQLILDRFIPKWPVQNNYFPLMECGLKLEEIAYVNLVRCRTEGGAPNVNTSRNCIQTHFEPWLDKLDPICVVFIGLWACERGRNAVAARGIRYTYVNRDRSLTAALRKENRIEVAAFVKAKLDPTRANASGSVAFAPTAFCTTALHGENVMNSTLKTLEIIKDLQAYGFNDDAFWRLHHFRNKSKKETINSFLTYCDKTSVFRPGGSNFLVHKRLVSVLETGSSLFHVGRASSTPPAMR